MYWKSNLDGFKKKWEIEFESWKPIISYLSEYEPDLNNLRVLREIYEFDHLIVYKVILKFDFQKISSNGYGVQDVGKCARFGQANKRPWSFDVNSQQCFVTTTYQVSYFFISNKIFC